MIPSYLINHINLKVYNYWDNTLIILGLEYNTHKKCLIYRINYIMHHSYVLKIFNLFINLYFKIKLDYLLHQKTTNVAI
jgi:hypothetical protein